MNAWYLIYSKPSQEDLAKINLERQGYQIYLPKMQVRRKKRGVTIKVIEPMFPRYLFVHLNEMTDNWAPIRSTIGVSKLVCFGLQAAKLPDELIELLIERENTNGFHDILDCDLKSGEYVRIAEGAMEGYEAVFTRHLAKDRVALLLEIAGKSLKINVKKEFIETIS